MPCSCKRVTFPHCQSVRANWIVLRSTSKLAREFGEIVKKGFLLARVTNSILWVSILELQNEVRTEEGVGERKHSK